MQLAPNNSDVPGSRVRHDWTTDEVRRLFDLPFADLLFQAQSVHRAHFDPNRVQQSTLLSIKTGGCPEDCAYCPQAARYQTGVEADRLLAVEEVVRKATEARDAGSTRYCMGAAWRSPRGRNFETVLDMIRAVRELGMETCATLGMLTAEQAAALADAGLDYYNHNIDTSPEHYGEIITTRTLEDRLLTLQHVREAGIHVCSGGIVGLGERRDDRVEFLRTLANLPEHPQSVPINLLVQVPGTPLHGTERLDPIEFVRTIAVARLLMPQSMVRLSAGREEMTDELQALCFLAGANSVFAGPRLLTTPNPQADRDRALFERLGIEPMAPAPRPAAAPSSPTVESPSRAG